ncbi:MAG: HYC_CC_PP family protein [Mucilaginibacter sp.]
MLKKSAAILLMLLYVSTVSGFALNLHYCFNRLSSVQIDPPAKTCAKNLAASKMKCCQDKHIEVKVKDAHHGSFGSVLSKIFNEDLPLILLGNTFFSLPVSCTVAVVYRGPPPIPDIALFLKHRTFRI